MTEPTSISSKIHGDDVEDAVVTGKRAMDPGFKRNIKIIAGAFGGAIALVVAMIAMRSGGAATNQGGSVDVTLPSSTAQLPEGEGLSPAMQQALKEKQVQERARANASGDSVYIPREPTESAQPIQTSTGTSPTGGGAQSPTPPTQQQPTMTEEERARLDRRREGLERQIGGLLALSEAGDKAPQRVLFAATRDGSTQQQVQQQAQIGDGAPGATQQGAPTAAPWVEGLEIASSETASAIDTYRTRYASARIVAGKLSGAFLTGSVTQTEEGLTIAYNLMRAGGKTCAIDAIALDERTSTDAMNADVDRRYLQRYVMPVLVAGLGGYAQARAQTGSTIVGLGGTSAGVGIETPSPTREQAVNAGAAAGLGILQREVEREAQKPFQITLPANTPIGILFRKPVETNCARSQ
jgi:hypothetical protein